jgi:hypothetical protein
MSKFKVGDRVKSTIDDEFGTIIYVYETLQDIEYAVAFDKEDYGLDIFVESDDHLELVNQLPVPSPKFNPQDAVKIVSGPYQYADGYVTSAVYSNLQGYVYNITHGSITIQANEDQLELDTSTTAFKPKFEIGDIVTRTSGPHAGMRFEVYSHSVAITGFNVRLKYDSGLNKAWVDYHEDELILVSRTRTYSSCGARTQATGAPQKGSLVNSSNYIWQFYRTPGGNAGTPYYKLEGWNDSESITSDLRNKPVETQKNCEHSYKDYTGLYESYKYCTKCDIKKH